MRIAGSTILSVARRTLPVIVCFYSVSFTLPSLRPGLLWLGRKVRSLGRSRSLVVRVSMWRCASLGPLLRLIGRFRAGWKLWGVFGIGVGVPSPGCGHSVHGRGGDLSGRLGPGAALVVSVGTAFCARGATRGEPWRNIGAPY